MKRTAPSKPPFSASMCAAPSNMAVMTVVTASVHCAGRSRGPGTIVRFGNAQGIHVGTQRDRAMGCAAAQCADHAGTTDPFGHIDAEITQGCGNKGGGTLFLETEFGVLMQVAPPLCHLLVKCFQINHWLSFLTTSSSTFAPSIKSFSAVNSAGLWLIPSFEGTKIIAVGATRHKRPVSSRPVVPNSSSRAISRAESIAIVIRLPL